MRKKYEKPVINIDDFEVTERIAGACQQRNDTIITNFHDANCIIEYEGYFADDICEMGTPGNDKCNDTYVDIEGYFWS
ncbi:hypothetical protein [Intestinibacter sp.]